MNSKMLEIQLANLSYFMVVLHLQSSFKFVFLHAALGLKFMASSILGHSTPSWGYTPAFITTFHGPPWNLVLERGQVS